MTNLLKRLSLPLDYVMMGQVFMTLSVRLPTMVLSFVLVALVLVASQVVWAADLTQVTVRPARLQANVAPGAILITLQTPESVVEDGIRVTIGQAWSNSGVAGEYTVSTVGLPAGTVALPGISTASSVVGKTVTFPSADLSPGVTYGFFLTGGITSNPPAGTGVNYVWNVATLVGGLPSSSQNAGVSISTNDQIVINATVGPTAGDFSADLTTPTTGTLSPGMILTYTITYSSNYFESSPITLQAEWDLGTLAGGGTPTVPVFEYVDGSASQAYSATDPIIDLLNRTITWSVSSIPANTQNETVSFQLRVANVDTGTTLVSVPVMARVIVPIVTPDSTITHQYQFTTPTPSPTPLPTSATTPTPLPTTSTTPTGQPAPTNTPVPGSSVTPTPRSSVTPTPTLPASGLIFTRIQPVQIGPDFATIEVTLSQPKSITLRYGTVANKLSTQIESSLPNRLHSIDLLNLQANTTYYFQIEAVDDNGQTIKSSLYQLTTAQAGFNLDLSQLGLIITTDGLLLYNQSDLASSHPLVIPVKTPFEVNLSLPGGALISRMSLEFLTEGDQSDQTAKLLPIILTETKPGTFNGKHQTLDRPQTQIMYLKVEDALGNRRLIPLLSIITSQPMQTISVETKQPIEHARLLLYRFDEVTKTYMKMPAPSLLGTNPVFSLSSGEFPVALPPGQYRAEVSAYGFHSQNIDFEIGGKNRSLYPTFVLSSSGWNLWEMARYYYEAIAYKITAMTESSSEIQSSKIIFDTVALVTLGILVGLSFISLAARVGVSIWHLPIIMMHRIKSLRQPQQFWILKGLVIDEQKQGISSASISVIGQNHQVLTQLITNAQGGFILRISESSVLLLVAATGYLPKEMLVVQEEMESMTEGKELIITLDRSFDQNNRWQTGVNVVKVAIKGLLELILILTLLMEILFIPHFGLGVVLPFLLLTIINLGMWLIHVYHEQTLMVGS